LGDRDRLSQDLASAVVSPRSGLTAEEAVEADAWLPGSWCGQTPM
jgi:hypothetical protein